MAYSRSMGEVPGVRKVELGTLLREADGLWRGPALADIREPGAAIQP